MHDGHDVVMVGGTFDATNVDLHVGKSSDQTHTVFFVANLWLTPSINPMHGLHSLHFIDTRLKLPPARNVGLAE